MDVTNAFWEQLLTWWVEQSLGAGASASGMANLAETLFHDFWRASAGAGVSAESTADPSAAAASTPAAPKFSATESLAGAFQAAAASTGLSPVLLEAVARQESGFNPDAVSSAGAVGVMQLMPATAAELDVNPYNAEENILGGARYLARLVNQFHSVPLALAAYNAGPGAVEQYGGVPPFAQTENYVRSIMATLPSGTATD